MKQCFCFGVLLVCGAGCVSDNVPVRDYISDLGIGSPDLFAVHSNKVLSRQTEIQDLLDRPEISLHDLLRIAELRSPGIAGAGNDVGAAAGRAWQVEMYPNPVLELEAEDMPTDSIGFSRSQNTISITQSFILGGRRTSAVSVAIAELDARVLILEQKRREVFNDVRVVYIEILYLRQAIALYTELLDIAGQTLKIASARLDARAAPEVEVLKSQIEVHELEIGKRKLERRLTASAEHLYAVLGDVQIPVTRVGGDIFGEVPKLPELDLLKMVFRKGHPGLLAALKEIEASERRIEQAKAERIPDLEFRLAYGRNTAANEDIIEAGISIPLPFFNRNQGRILETRYLAGKARKNAETLANHLSIELAAVYASYMTARDEAAIFRNQIIPAAERVLSQVQAGYEAGRTGLLDLLDAQRTLARARVSMLESFKDVSIARAHLLKIIGSEEELNSIGGKP